MTGSRSWLAERVLKHAASVMPEARKEWGRAMLAEAEHLAAADRLSFAFGCVRSSYFERLTDAATQLAMGRWGILLGLCAAAALCLRTSQRLGPGDPSSLVLALGVIGLAAALAFVRWGFSRLPAIAVAGFTAALGAILVLGDPAALGAGAMRYERFYRAILLEQFVAWAVLFGLAHLLLAVEARRSADG